MALEKVFTRAATLNKLRRSPQYIALDGFCQWLLDQGYSHNAIRIHTWYVQHLTVYLDRLGIAGPTRIQWKHVQSFFTYWSKHARQRENLVLYRCMRCVINRFTKHLVSAGFLAALPAPTPPFYQALLEEYLSWLKEHCARSIHTLVLRRRYLPPFLQWLGPRRCTPQRLSKLSGRCLQGFILRYARLFGGTKPTAVATAMRSFCRFCLHRGYMASDLSSAIPCFQRRRLSRIPQGISQKDAQKLLQSIQRKTPMGRRDYAMIQLLYTYGVRAGQVSRLRLDDIQWAAGRICFRAHKGGKTVLDPITNETGQSLLAYLKHGRPISSCPEVFLRARGSCRPISSAQVSTIVNRWMASADIDMTSGGARVFRHGFATRMLAKGHSLKFIADMLGHRDIQTTSIYAKVDFNALQGVALPWPKEQP